MTAERMHHLLVPFYADASERLIVQLGRYLDLLQRWNARTNLTAVREGEAIVTRHFGESLFAARFVPAEAKKLLDLGSGAGLPGLPIALVHPLVKVTLAESQGKKAAFLQEAVRTLDLRNVTVWARRAELQPLDLVFDVVTARAVDVPEAALVTMRQRTRPGGLMMQLCSAADATEGSTCMSVPGTESRVVALAVRP